MPTTIAATNEQETWKSPWEAQEVRADGPILLSDEKSGDPFMSFICEEIRNLLSALKWSWLVEQLYNGKGKTRVAALFGIMNFAMYYVPS